MSNEHENQTTEDRGQMKQKSWWAYIPEVCEAGVVVDAYTLEEALVEAKRELMEAPWTEAYTIAGHRRPQEFYIWELGALTMGYLSMGEEE
jgi:predicted RNase H-like HicB family nuclease